MKRNSASMRTERSALRRTLGAVAISSIVTLPWFGTATAAATPVPLEPFTPPAQVAEEAATGSEDPLYILSTGSGRDENGVFDPVRFIAQGIEQTLCYMAGSSNDTSWKCFGNGRP